MALPQDFWQNEHMFHRFRSKPCQRLLRSGICEWHSQCQFSHDPEWPRRPPNKHNYSPVICPNLRPVVINDTGEVKLENHCPAGLACAFAHTKDEVLYHPSLFKTTMCEEHRLLMTDVRGARRSKNRPRCHRYYCPFAHGKQELRSSPMAPEQREAAISAIASFVPAVCCSVCTHNQLGPPCPETPAYTGNGQQAQAQESLWGQNEAQLWQGTSQPLLSEMLLGRNTADRATSEGTNPHVWNANPWLQQPLQPQASNLSSLSTLNVAKQDYATIPPARAPQDTESDDGEVDINSEICKQTLRFLDEISTEESGSEDNPSSSNGSKDADHMLPLSYSSEISVETGYGGFSSIWQPQKASWVPDASRREPWHATNCWSIRSTDRCP